MYHCNIVRDDDWAMTIRGYQPCQAGFVVCIVPRDSAGFKPQHEALVASDQVVTLPGVDNEVGAP